MWSCEEKNHFMDRYNYICCAKLHSYTNHHTYCVRWEHKIHTYWPSSPNNSCVPLCVCVCVIVFVCDLYLWHDQRTERWWIRLRSRRVRRRRRQQHYSRSDSRIETRCMRVYGFTLPVLPLSYKWNEKNISFSVRRPLATETNCFVLSTHSQSIHSRSCSRAVWVCSLFTYVYAARVCILTNL